jgi:uncharacterized protein YggE
VREQALALQKDLAKVSARQPSKEIDMKIRFGIAIAIIFIIPSVATAQHGGNIGYSQSGAKARAEQLEQNRRILHEFDKPPSGTATFVEANVLMNVKADEYVAVFGIAEEGVTVAEAGSKMDAVVKEFTNALKAIGIAESDLYLDFVSQSRTYGFEMIGNIAKEKLVGFELKKNLSIHYKDRDLLDKLAVAASQSKIYDLIKVDYVVRDIATIHDKLMAEAASVIKKKGARYENLLGIKLQGPMQVYAEKYGTTFPSTMYDNYVAAETEEISGQPDRQRYTIQSMRKTRGAVYNGLDGNGFDTVINSVMIEPVVQFTLHLKVKYEVEQTKGR